jgi:polysaccharide export outer membrane protein
MLVAGKLQDFLINPQVTIFIKEYGNKKIYVLGEVKKPGAYELPVESRLTVLEAVSLAEGFTPIAAKDRTKIIRSMRDGKSLSLTIEISAITTRGEKEKDIPLEPNDVVWVPQSYF